MSGLLPCPFCGGEADVSWYAKGSSPDRAGYFVECEGCSASGEPFDIQGEMPDRDEFTKEHAIAAWNRRAATASPAHASDEIPGNTSTLPPPAWRLIETAPRDGTHIIIAFGQDGVMEAWWRDDDADPYPWKFVDRGTPGSTGEAAGGFINGSREVRGGPTHWMPLPDAPTPSEDRDKGIGGEEEGASVAESGGTASPKSDSPCQSEGGGS